MSDDLLKLARNIMQVGLISANFAVCLGVYLEDEKFSDKIKALGWKTLILALAFEATLGIFIYTDDALITSRLESKILTLTQDDTKTRTALAGRRITKKQHDVLVDILKKNPSVFDLETLEAGEPSIYASDILATLKDGNWTLGQSTFPQGVVWTGLVIFLSDDPAALKLGLALKSANIPFVIGDQHRDKATIMVGALPPVFSH